MTASLIVATGFKHNGPDHKVGPVANTDMLICLSLRLRLGRQNALQLFALLAIR